MNSACASPRQRARTCTRRRPHEPRRGARRVPHFHARERLMPALHSAARHSTRVRHPHIASSPAHARHPHPRSAPRPAHAKPRCGPTLSGPAVGGRARAPGAGSRSRDGAQLSSTRGNARYVYPACACGAPTLGVARRGPYVWWDGEQQRDMRARTEKRRRVRVLYT